MDAAKQFVSQFTSKRGHKTYVDETVRPAVTFETIKPTRHEIVTQAIDKEVHQHHYHTTVQPLSHKEVLPTKHTHNLLTTIHRDYAHKTRDINVKVKDTHAKELALFANSSVTLPTTHTVSAAPAVVGEHVHHHVHEIVQPILFKEVVMPEVVHTSIPIHEVHHIEPLHHGMSEIAAVPMEAFLARSKATPSLNKEVYDGQPRPYNTKLSVDPTKYMRQPAAINTSVANRNTNRNTMSTPPLSPASAASSPSMPSTPKSSTAVEPGVRTSEDNYNNFSLSNSPTTKTTTKTTTTTMRNGEIIKPQRIRF